MIRLPSTPGMSARKILPASVPVSILLPGVVMAVMMELSCRLYDGAM